MLSPSAGIWRETALLTLDTAKQLRDSSDPRSCVSRAYYATYQAATFVCLTHGDAEQFPHDWNNPSHEQLPDLIRNNGDYTMLVRRAVVHNLRELRSLREDSDYKPGKIVDATTVRSALESATDTFRLLEIQK